MQYSLTELFKTEKVVLAPEVYDCASAKTVEMCGYKASVLSGAELSASMLGIPDLGIMNVEELYYATSRICNAHKLPMVVDAEDGYGPAINAYNTCKRLAKCGAGGVIIVDSVETRIGSNPPCLPLDEAIGKYKACAEALKGTDCILVARTDATDFDDALNRSIKYREAGADMTLVFMINYLDHDKRFDACKEIAKHDKGWKWYPDLGCHDGKSDVTLAEIAEYGFNFVGVHYLLGSAMYGMIDCGRHTFERQDNTYFEPMNIWGPLRDVENIEFLYNLERSWNDDPDLIKRWPYSFLERYKNKE
jgi:2-methylisocitrate lyase-like PEP mutase family enzyme